MGFRVIVSSVRVVAVVVLILEREYRHGYLTFSSGFLPDGLIS